MLEKRFQRLLRRDIITPEALRVAAEESSSDGRRLEELLRDRGVPRHELLFCISETYNLPVVEYREDLLISRSLLRRLDLEQLKRSLWVPLSAAGDKAEVIAYRPDDERVAVEIRTALGVREIDFLAALPEDIIRIIENNQDLNPDFPQQAGRTPLALVRTFLAERRSLFASSRTSLARGRTGLSFMRTGISFITIGIVLFRVFGPGYPVIADLFLGAAGAVMAMDGLIWYLPARRTGRTSFSCIPTEATCGTTVLAADDPGDSPVFRRTPPAAGAAELRTGWNDLSPVMRRRFLAGDRTDLAEERTVLACYRSIMARSRTGLAFTRTGVAFMGLGIALLRQFGTGPWTIFDFLLVITGISMTLEGVYWYLPGRIAGKEGLSSVKRAGQARSIWDFAFPPAIEPGPVRCASGPPVRPSHAPGIWGTTGLALERTLLAERRNVMARVRTVMARSRTGLAFIRTGMSVAAVGFGLLVYFGAAGAAWLVINLFLILAGILCIADGLYWHLPAERLRRQFPYCFGDMEISVPDYGRPGRCWGKAVFSHGDV